MRNNKVIDPSLNKKIAENEKRMQHLFNSEFSISKSKNNIKKPSNSQTNMRNVHHKKQKSQDEIYNTAYKTIDNRDINRLKGAFNITISKTIEKGDDNDSSAFENRMAKRMNQKKQAEQKEEEKNNKTFHDTINNIYQKFQERKNKNKKVYNKGQVNNIVDRLYTNDYKTKKKPNNENRHNRNKKEYERENNTIDFSLKPGSNGNIMKRQNEPNNANVDDMIERFEEDMKKRSENMERKRQEIKRNEKKIYTYKPKINETNRRSESAGKDDFLERQKRYEEKKKKKEKRFIEDLKNEEEKKINENNFLLQKNNRKEKKGKNDENEKNDKNKSDNIKKKEEVDKRIKYMYDWENKRKEKIENKMKEKTGKAETEFDYMPKINERSSSMANKSKRRREEPDVFSRLAKEDKMLKEKRQVLIDLYKPSFQPNTFLHTQKIRKNKEKEGKKEVKKKEYPKIESSSDSDSDSDDDDDDDDGEDNNEESSSDSDEKEDNFDYKQDPKIFAEDSVQDAIRKAVFNKMKK